ncbi:hypothetical protein GON03_00955 [Nocardioides sp. MAH-18]|uniref:DUF1542 domain-containing protein n=1 Tax=Nocardioides agri TaxID=2682843 RepID=A0A6L6XKU5_9ACTN|nr:MULTISPECIES: hypothetical protein [unclassified Nocardioides]MBA2956586.1 hypothetical protein [Nocardioides sp. CGMCC 1.13656]MVQ47730.1 hypothetical protein [Nocardioides sp. MAH-18]
MMGVILVLLVISVVALVVAQRRSRQRELERREAELAPVRQLTFEDVTALGEQLRELDVDLAGRQLDEGERADYQRALDAYEAAKTAADAIAQPDDVRHVTQILDDGRYAMACVRARVAGEALPVRRPACFFDPRHSTAVTDVLWAPPGGAPRDVPACALDAERVRVGADPDSRMVMAGAQRVPYYQAGPAYAPYAAGTFGGLGPILFTGLLFGGLGGFDMVGDGLGAVGDGIGDGIGDIGDGIGDIGDGIGDAFGDFGGFDF